MDEEVLDLKLGNPNMPWLIFEIQNTLYAIGCSKIQSIIMMQEEGERSELPDSPQYIRSITKVRGNIVPVLDLRELYGLLSVEKEYEVFKDQMDKRKQEHIHWVSELERCVRADETFTLATDPHQCAFGKWLYNHESDHSSVNFVLNKIREPHRKLHETAFEVLSCAQQHDQCAKEKCLKIQLAEVKEELMPKILNTLDQVKEVFIHSYQEKMIILEDGNRRIGVVVDDVKAIDEITLAQGQEEFTDLMRNQFVFAVGRGKKIDDLVLLIHAEDLLDLVQEGDERSEYIV